MSNAQDYRAAWAALGAQGIPAKLLSAMELAGVFPPSSSAVKDLQIVNQVWGCQLGTGDGNVAVGTERNFVPMDQASLSAPFNLQDGENGGAAVIMRAGLYVVCPAAVSLTTSTVNALVLALAQFKAGASFLYESPNSNAKKYSHAARHYTDPTSVSALAAALNGDGDSSLQLGAIPGIVPAGMVPFADLESIFWRAGSPSRFGLVFGRTNAADASAPSITGLNDVTLQIYAVTQSILLTREQATEVGKLVGNGCNATTPDVARARRVVLSAPAPNAGRMPVQGR